MAITYFYLWIGCFSLRAGGFMKNNLFKILVLGGAALAASPVMAQDVSIETEPKQQVFCKPTTEANCEVKVVDNQCQSVPKEGLECCWGTSCE
jgi:hypothetical protein